MDKVKLLHLEFIKDIDDLLFARMKSNTTVQLNFLEDLGDFWLFAQAISEYSKTMCLKYEGMKEW